MGGRPNALWNNSFLLNLHPSFSECIRPNLRIFIKESFVHFDVGGKEVPLERFYVRTHFVSIFWEGRNLEVDLLCH